MCIHVGSMFYFLLPLRLGIRVYSSFCHVEHCALSCSGADPGFLERGFMCIKGWGFALLILSHFS